MVEYSHSISLGDAVIAVGMIGSVAYNYYAVVRRVDRIANRQAVLDKTVSELRHGIGLVLPGNWPQTVQRCFGFQNGRAHDRS